MRLALGTAFAVARRITLTILPEGAEQSRLAEALTSPRVRGEVGPSLPSPARGGGYGGGRVKGRLSESELVEAPPHPDPLHSPSKTGVNALMASGEREQRRRAASDAQRPPVGERGRNVLIPGSVSGERSERRPGRRARCRVSWRYRPPLRARPEPAR